MKKSAKYLIISFLSLILLACETIVDDLNTDPNNPTDASAELMLTGVELANMTLHEGHTARLAGMWSGYFVGVARQYPDYSNYNATGSTFDQIWQNIYAGVLQNGNIIIQKATELDNQLLIGIVKVVQAHALGTTTALWGDIPYTQAANRVEFPNPAFDPQIHVYENVQKLLDEAITLLESGKGSVSPTAEIYFGGNRAKWLEVAHTLKARFYLEVRNYPAAYEQATQGISKATNSLLAPHGTTIGDNENLMFSFLGRGRSGDMNSGNTFITKVLNATNPLYKGNAKTNESARFTFYFQNINNPNEITPNISSEASNRGVFARDAGFPLVTYQENLLILAEAGLRSQGFAVGLNRLNNYRAFMATGGYLDPTYTKGYTLVYVNYTEEDFAPTGIANTLGVSPESAILREILLERYVTFFGQQLGFTDIRRTRTEAEGVKPPANIGSALPERFIYSQSEVNSNTSAPETVPGLFEKTPVNAR